MRIFAYPGKVEKTATVVALGVFDGVHLGHRALLVRAKEEAEKRSLPLTVFTFAEGGALKEGAPRIYPEEEKLALFESLGADRVILCDFSAVRALSPVDFCREVLCSALGAKAAVCGYNFRFGAGAKGDAKTLAEELAVLGADTVTVPPVTVDGEPVSSSGIRRLLAEGEIERANRLLGAPYRVTAKVSHGNAVGRTHGIPTANSPAGVSDLLKKGVYRTAVLAEGRVFPAVTNLGTCPTFGDRPNHLETHLLDYSGDLYGEEYTLVFLGFLRPEKPFSGEKDLYMQINIDISEAKRQNAADDFFRNSNI